MQWFDTNLKIFPKKKTGLYILCRCFSVAHIVPKWEKIHLSIFGFGVCFWKIGLLCMHVQAFNSHRSGKLFLYEEGNRFQHIKNKTKTISSNSIIHVLRDFNGPKGWFFLDLAIIALRFTFSFFVSVCVSVLDIQKFFALIKYNIDQRNGSNLTKYKEPFHAKITLLNYPFWWFNSPKTHNVLCQSNDFLVHFFISSGILFSLISSIYSKINWYLSGRKKKF